MKKPLLTMGLSLALIAPLAVQAGAKEDYEALYQKAQSTHKDAGTFQWTVTDDQLKAAKSAAEVGDYEKAKTMANDALKLAEESVGHRKKQQEAWRQVAIGN